MIEVLTRFPNSQYLPALEAGIKIGLRPSTVLLRDHYALNRSVFNWDTPEKDPVWKTWDYALLTAISSIDRFRNQETGQLRWFDESDDVMWKVRITNSGSLYAKERYEQSERGKNLQPGERMELYYELDEGAEEPTFTKWLAEKPG